MLDDDVPVEGFAIAGFALAQGLLSLMVGRGLITKVDADNLVEALLQSVEEMPIHSPGADAARGVLDQIARTLPRLRRAGEEHN